jgi:hypothetical protein
VQKLHANANARKKAHIRYDSSDDSADDFADDFVHFVDEDDVFSTSFEALFARKALFKVFIFIRKRALAKKKISFSSSSKIIIYLLNVKMMYEKNVIFQIFISRQFNSESITYDEKAFHFISHKMNMKEKARRFANAKIFACHLISVKTTMM